MLWAKFIDFFLKSYIIFTVNEYAKEIKMYRYVEMHNLKSSGAIKTTPRLGRINPIRIIGGVYFVGTYQASSHIIDTGDGLIMIDTG